jgi:ATP sulfurylase
MKLYDIILKEIKRLTDMVKKNAIAKASLAIAIALAVRKIILMRTTNTKEARVIVETISSFYEKLSDSNVKNVTILSDSIRYRDLTERVYQAILPKNLHAGLE